MKGKNIVYLFIISLFAITCKNDNRVIDVSNIHLDIKVKRLDKDIFEIDLDNIRNDVDSLKNIYDEFFKLYNFSVIRLGNPDNEKYCNNLKAYVTDYTMNKVYSETMKVYPDLKIEEQDLENAFKRFKYYFPNKKTPAVYSYIGGFNQSIVVADSILGIGLDKYLGSNCVFYDKLRIANYLQFNMNRDMIAIDAIKSWLLTEFVYNDSIDNLVNNMIYQGKIQYALKYLFPEKADSLLFGFKGKDIYWCENNESQMWNYLIENKLLFSTDYMLINKFINPAPFTAGFPNASPGRATIWVGEKIVSNYMKQNSNISLNELMHENNYQKILSGSKYEP